MDFVLRPRVGQFEPNADVFLDEDSRRIVVKVELAGADPDSVRVEVRERSLVITGVRHDGTRTRVGSIVQKEIAYGEFSKEIHLPVAVRFEKIVAEYADGILVIALPTSETHYVPTTRTAIAMIVKRTLV
jgi:HSP20 family protein